MVEVYDVDEATVCVVVSDAYRKTLYDRVYYKAEEFEYPAMMIHFYSKYDRYAASGIRIEIVPVFDGGVCLKGM